MMSKLWLVLVALPFLLLACAPAAAPAPAPAPQPPAPKAPVSLSAEEAAWQKVVEGAKQEGKIALYSFSLTGDAGIATSRAFEEAYGIKVDLITGRGAEFLERIRTEQRVKQVVADFMEASSTHTLNLKSAGGTVSSKDLPALREKDVWRVDPLAADSEGHLLVQRSMYLSPWVNSNLVKPAQEPKSYRDLGKLEWKGKIMFSDPSVSTGAYNVFLPLMDRGYLDMEFVRSLKGQDLKFVPGTRDIARALAKGEVLFGLPISDVDAYPFVNEGAPIKAIALEEGTIINLSAMVAVKGAPHPNATKLFMNWLLGPEGQKVYSKALNLSSVRKDGGDFRHPDAAVVAKRLLPTTEEDAQKQAKAFRDKTLVELWRK